MASRKFERPFNRETVSNTAETSKRALLQVRGSDGRYPGDDERDKAKLKSICSFAINKFQLRAKVGRVKGLKFLSYQEWQQKHKHHNLQVCYHNPKES